MLHCTSTKRHPTTQQNPHALQRLGNHTHNSCSYSKFGNMCTRESLCPLDHDLFILRILQESQFSMTSRLQNLLSLLQAHWFHIDLICFNDIHHWITNSSDECVYYIQQNMQRLQKAHWQIAQHHHRSDRMCKHDSISPSCSQTHCPSNCACVPQC